MSVVNITKDNFREEVVNCERPVLSPIVDEIAAERGDIKVGKVNVDEQPELAGQFGVMSIPTLVVVKGGRVVKQMVGARPKGQILAML